MLLLNASQRPLRFPSPFSPFTRSPQTPEPLCEDISALRHVLDLVAAPTSGDVRTPLQPRHYRGTVSLQPNIISPSGPRHPCGAGLVEMSDGYRQKFHLYVNEFPGGSDFLDSHLITLYPYQIGP